MPDPHQDFTFILVRTRFASNLGSAVRVMGNMGFSQLVLVRPGCEVGMEARSHAMRAAAVLDRAEFAPTLESASAGCDALVATTGVRGGDTIDLANLTGDMLPAMGGLSVGLVFGSEDNGLRAPELDMCQYRVRIPTGGSHSSLNLAQAVAIVAYEVHQALVASAGTKSVRRADSAEMETLVAEASGLVEALQYPAREAAAILARVKRLTARARLEPEDVKMLLGLLKRVGAGEKSRD